MFLVHAFCSLPQEFSFNHTRVGSLMENATGFSDDVLSWSLRVGYIEYVYIVSVRVVPPSWREDCVPSAYHYGVFLLHLCVGFLLFGVNGVRRFEALGTLDICNIVADSV